MQFPKRIRLPHDAYANPEAVFHVVFRAMPGTQPFAAEALGAAVWQLFVNELTAGRVFPLAACLMPDHLHAIVSPGDRSLVRWVNGFKSYSTRTSWHFGAATALWQPGFYDRRIRDGEELGAAIQYVTRNPVAAALVDSEADWPWVGVWSAAG